jgi:oligosaccharide repeat unit polymerase
MLLIAILTLITMAALNYCFVKRLFYPPLVFCLVWAADLSIVALAGNFFYPISEHTLFIFCLGAVAFSVGGWLSLCAGRPKPIEYTELSSSKLLNCLLLTACIAVPLVYRWAIGFSDSGSFSVLAVRMALVNAGNESDVTSSFYENFVTLGAIVSTLAFLEDGRKRKIFAFLVATVLVLLTGSRTAIATLLFSAFFLDWVRRGKLRWKIIVPVMASALLLFSVTAVLLGHGDTSSESSITENVTPAAELIASYTSGGPVAFDQVVRHPGVVAHNWQISRAPMLTLNKFGAHFDVPELHAEYVTIGPNFLLQNVYTMYFAYYDWGLAGMMMLTAIDGFIVTWLFRRALVGHKIAAVLCAYFVAECVLSIFNENFFLGLNYIVKLAALSWVVYSLPIYWRKFRQFCSDVVARSVPPDNAASSIS